MESCTNPPAGRQTASDASMAPEIWKSVLAGAYEVSNHGRVRNAVTGRVLHRNRTPKGYLSVSLGGRGHRVHRLVCAAFNGPMPFAGAEVRHLDGTRDNNVPENLMWGTHYENIQDMIAHGRVHHGERNSQSCLTQDQAEEIRNFYALIRRKRATRAPVGVSATLATDYCISRRSLRDLVAYRSYRQNSPTRSRQASVSTNEVACHG